MANQVETTGEADVHVGLFTGREVRKRGPDVGHRPVAIEAIGIGIHASRSKRIDLRQAPCALLACAPYPGACWRRVIPRGRIGLLPFRCHSPTVSA